MCWLLRTALFANLYHGSEIILECTVMRIETWVRCWLDHAEPTDKSRWERVSELQFQQGGLMLTPYPFLLTLYLETHDGLHAHTAKQSGAWTPVRAAEQGALPLPPSLTCQHKRSRTEQPPGGSPTQRRCGGARPPPERTTGAETMAGDRRVCLPAKRRPAVSTHHAPTALRPVTAAHDHRLTHRRTQVPGHLAAVNTAPGNCFPSPCSLEAGGNRGSTFSLVLLFQCDHFPKL
ncbi:uncharacterized protein LOC135251559 isoform X2 [Anguilla rostrata]|uniref:uncharacterized protein LOC135251559 isoform X2 n=1 Tax=Anguilla rostrata TaxID=7938 RepID=UPI0030D5857E